MKNIEKKKSKSYNKTLVVGHSLCEYKPVIDLLSASGMSLANPLKKERIHATEISTALLKAHESESNGVEQLEISQVWDGLALDLLMSNIDEKWWGWADSNAVSLLNYWKSLDTRLVFILVYDTPRNFIKQILNKKNFASADELQKDVTEWCEYNKALLKFYYHNPESSLLVNTEQAKTSSTTYLEQVSNQIGIKDADITSTTVVSMQKSFQDEEDDDALFSYLVKELLEQYPEMTALFEELQSVANLPFDTMQESTSNSFDAIAALMKDKKKQYTLTQLESQKKKQEELLGVQKQNVEENELLVSQLMQIQETLEESYIDNQKYTKELTDLKKSLTNKNDENNTLKIKLKSQKQNVEENELLVSQLMQIQETLEESYIDNQKYTKELTDLKKSLTNKNDENNTLKIKLKSQKQNVEENELLLTQLMQVQEELEKYYLENIALKEVIKDKKRQYGAVDRVKEQLSYRLGAKMIEQSKSFSGILGLPFSLKKVHSAYKKDMKDKKGKKLPPIDTYADAHDAENIKQHLSYKLGQAMVESSKTTFGFFKLPSALKKAHKEFKESRKNV